MIATSFDVALSKFHRSHSSDSPYEHGSSTALAQLMADAVLQTVALYLARHPSR